MRPVTAAWIAEAVGGTLVAPANALVTSVWNDTRTLGQGALYVAIVGESFDGHAFVDAAAAAGASLSLVSKPVDAPHVLVDDVPVALGALAREYLKLLRAEGQITVIGITGSNGKTTTKDLLSRLLPAAHAPIKSYNDATGMPLTVLGAGPETRHLILEMGASAPGDLAYLTSIAPLDIAVVLMVGSAHAAGYGSPDGLAHEKSTIIDGLVPGGVAVLNADDPRVAAMAVKAERVCTFGFGPADVHGEHRRVEDGGPVFEVDGITIRSGLLGDHHASNLLAAIAVAGECGIGTQEAANALAGAKAISAHRMALTVRADGVRILDDAYNASPESMRAALRALKSLGEGGRTWAVIGEMREMGEASLDAHTEIGADVVRLGIDHLLVVGHGARPAYVAAVREGSWADEAAFVATIDEAREALAAALAPGDTVLVKGSHGTGLWRLAEQLIGDDA